MSLLRRAGPIDWEDGPVRRPGVVLLLAVLAGSGCGGEDRPEATTPAEALRGFYAGVLRDQDFEAACRYAAPGFYLRVVEVVGVNVKADRADEKLSQLPRARAAPRRGRCPALAKRIYETRGDDYPWSAWTVDSVRIKKNGDTAEAFTMDGAAGLRLLDGEWGLLWVLDSRGRRNEPARRRGLP